MISINAATLEDLCEIPGVGPAIAQRILDYRQDIGNFQTLEDIMLIRGIKEKLFLKMKEYITL